MAYNPAYNATYCTSTHNRASQLQCTPVHPRYIEILVLPTLCRSTTNYYLTQQTNTSREQRPNEIWRQTQCVFKLPVSSCVWPWEFLLLLCQFFGLLRVVGVLWEHFIQSICLLRPCRVALVLWPRSIFMAFCKSIVSIGFPCLFN